MLVFLEKFHGTLFSYVLAGKVKGDAWCQSSRVEPWDEAEMMIMAGVQYPKYEVG